MKLKIYKPAIFLTSFMLASWLVYNLAWRIENHSLHQIIGFISGLALFVSVGFGVFIVYPVMYLKGPGFMARAFGSYLTPFVWMIKESTLLCISYSAAECLYYMLNPLNIAITLVMIGQMGLSEAVLRIVKEKDKRKISGLIVPLFVFVFGFTSAIGLLLWGQGENAYVLFLENYRSLFGSGLQVK
jgi:hypothetical protein